MKWAKRYNENEEVKGDFTPKKIPKELTLKLMKVSDEILLNGTSAPSEFIHKKYK